MYILFTLLSATVFFFLKVDKLYTNLKTLLFCFSYVIEKITGSWTTNTILYLQLAAHIGT